MAHESKKPKIDPNLIIAVGVLIASFSALFVYMRQAAIMSEQTAILMQQTKASAWPRPALSVNRAYDTEGKVTQLSIHITNKGTGPAIIEGAMIKVGDRPVKDWQEFHEVIGVPDSVKINFSYSSIYGNIITPNEEFRLIDWSFNDPLMEYIQSKADKISISICYRSVFDEFWILEREGFKNFTKNNVNVSENCSFSADQLFQE